MNDKPVQNGEEQDIYTVCKYRVDELTRLAFIWAEQDRQLLMISLLILVAVLLAWANVTTDSLVLRFITGAGIGFCGWKLPDVLSKEATKTI